MYAHGKRPTGQTCSSEGPVHGKWPTPHSGISFQHRLYLNQSKRILNWNGTISSLNRKFVTLGLELKEQEVGFGDTLAPCSSRKRCTKYHFDYSGLSLSPVLWCGNAHIMRILLLGVFPAPNSQNKGAHSGNGICSCTGSKLAGSSSGISPFSPAVPVSTRPGCYTLGI